MFPLGIDGLKSSLDDLRSVVRFQEAARVHFVEEPDLSPVADHEGAAGYIDARNAFPAAPAFQVYVHCAIVTRLYAIYETYIYDLAGAWLSELCAYAGVWTRLPESVCRSYRVGTGQLLQKFGGPRTAHLTEMSLVEPLYKGLSGSDGLALVPDAFFVDMPNLREGDLANLFSKVGLPGALEWLRSNPKLAKYCEDQNVSVASRLKELVDYRNDAAHGAIQIDQVIGASEFLSFADFIGILCEVLAEFVRSNVVANLISGGRLGAVGKVTEFYAKPQASIVTMKAAKVCRGDTVVALTPTRCFSALVESIQVGGLEAVEVEASDGQELGICFAPPVSDGADIVIELPLSEPSDETAGPIPVEGEEHRGEPCIHEPDEVEEFEAEDEEDEEGPASDGLEVDD